MKKRTREKVALLVFALLVVLGGSVLLRYFETGRSFNMAATAVDDAFGQMSGYTAIVFDGTYDVAALLYAVADDDDLFEAGVVFAHGDVDGGLVVDVDCLGFVAHIAEIQAL